MNPIDAAVREALRDVPAGATEVSIRVREPRRTWPGCVAVTYVMPTPIEYITVNFKGVDDAEQTTREDSGSRQGPQG